MSDNHTNHEKVYLEKGWAAMNRALDDDLPILFLAPRTWFRWNWIFGALFILMAAVGFYFSNKSTGDAPRDSDQKLAIFSEKTNDIEELEPKTANNLPKTTQNEAASNSKKVVKNVKSSKLQSAFLNPQKNVLLAESSVNPPKKAIVSNSKTLNFSEIDAPKSTVETTQKISELPTFSAPPASPFSDLFAQKGTENLGKSISTLPSSKVIEVAKIEAGLDKKKEIIRQNLRLELIFPIQIETVNNTRLRPNIGSKFDRPIKIAKYNKYKFGFVAALQTLDFQALNGFSVGFLTEFRLKNRMHLSVGLGWNRIILNAVPGQNSEVSFTVEHFSYLDKTHDEALVFTDQSKTYSTGKDVNAADFSIHQAVVANVLHRIELPIFVSKKIGNRWSAGVGLSPSFQLSARSVQNAATFKFAGNYSDNLVTNSSLKTDQYSLRSVNNLLTKNLPRFDLAAGLTLGFALNRHWQTNISVQQGLLNQTKYRADQTRVHQTRWSVIRWF